jgi:hypothetical protein
MRIKQHVFEKRNTAATLRRHALIAVSSNIIINCAVFVITKLSITMIYLFCCYISIGKGINMYKIHNVILEK